MVELEFTKVMLLLRKCSVFERFGLESEAFCSCADQYLPQGLSDLERSWHRRAALQLASLSQSGAGLVFIPFCQVGGMAAA